MTTIQELTPQELRLRFFLRVLFFFYIGAVLLYLLPGMTFIPGFLKPYVFIADPAFANNSSIKMGVFVLLCFFGAADVRKYLIAVEVIIVVMFLAVVSGSLIAAFSNNNYDLIIGGKQVPMSTMIIYSTLFDLAINMALILFYTSAQKARHQLQYFTVGQFRTLEAIAEVVIEGEKELVPPNEIARNVDGYMARFLAKTKWVSKLALMGIEYFPLLFFKPPISYMQVFDRKRFLQRHFYQHVTLHLTPKFIRFAIQGVIRLAKQLCYMGYYNDKRTFESIGYIPFSQRVDTPTRKEKFPIQPPKPLSVLKEKDVEKTDVLEWHDVVIIGSGPGASVLAKGLLDKGRSVLMIERGKHTDPSEFTEDEIEMVSQLYADGALQLAADFSFQVFQGSAVGGSSVVNNAVCFDTPDTILDKWNDRSHLNAGLDLNRYKACNHEINSIIGVRNVNDNPPMTVDEYLNPGGKKFIEGCQKLKLDQSPNVLSSVSANVLGCLGCGYCNIGCAYGKKLSMLDTVLPQSQQKHGRDKLKILAGCEVLKIKSKGKRITSVIGRFESGRKIEIKGKTFVVAAGAISSSILLQRSGIAVGKAGKNVSFNIGSPISAVFPEIIDSYKGIQISHYLQLNPSRGYVFETWYNPPMFQSTAIPGWWSDHFNNMKRYNRIACTGVLVGSESNAEARIGGLTRREIKYTPTKKDLNTLIDGLALAGEIYLAAGAECVMPNTFAYHEYNSGKNPISKMKEHIRDNADIGLGTGHPQGGNIISLDEKLGVVNNEMQVYGYDNLFVCDASLFPSSVGVNPQITVMTLAHYAVPFVAANNPQPI